MDQSLWETADNTVALGHFTGSETRSVLQGNTSVLNFTIPALVVVAGPTATGKSKLAVQLAQWLRGIILNADSRQVYREFDIGTAKPTPAEQQQAPHLLLDVCDPQITLTVADYQQMAQAAIAQCHHRQQVPMLVGGTGLYIRSVIRGLQIPRVGPQPELRSQLQALGQHHCYGLLLQVDPVSAQKIHQNDQVRTLRALEVFYTTGRPMSTQQGELPPAYPVLQFGLDCQDTERLARRIELRTEAMINQGFVAEVEALIHKYGPDLPLLKTLGYREIADYIAGALTLNEAKALTVLHTRQFAKRQRTWFRADPHIHWLDSDDPLLLDRAWQHIEAFAQTIQLSH